MRKRLRQKHWRDKRTASKTEMDKARQRLRMRKVRERETEDQA